MDEFRTNKSNNINLALMPTFVYHYHEYMLNQVLRNTPSQCVGWRASIVASSPIPSSCNFLVLGPLLVVVLCSGFSAKRWMQWLVNKEKKGKRTKSQQRKFFRFYFACLTVIKSQRAIYCWTTSTRKHFMLNIFFI